MPRKKREKIKSKNSRASRREPSHEHPEDDKNNASLSELRCEELFRLWISGRSLTEIYELHLGTELSFSYSALVEAMKKYEWKARKEKIAERIKKSFEDDYLNSQKEQMQSIQLIINMNIDRIRRDYIKYFKDPEEYIKKAKKEGRRPAWLMTDMSEMLNLIKTYSLSAQPRKNSKEEDSNSVAVNNFNRFYAFTPEQEEKMWAVLRERATKSIMKPNEQIEPAIPAEIVE